jgi:hypothetical protein
MHADGFVAESETMSRQFFFGFFYFPATWRKGPAKLSPTDPEKTASRKPGGFFLGPTQARNP